MLSMMLSASFCVLRVVMLLVHLVIEVGRLEMQESGLDHLGAQPSPEELLRSHPVILNTSSPI